MLADNVEQAQRYREHFLRVGVDGLTGYVSSLDGLLEDGVTTISAEELPQSDTYFLVDVRNMNEYTVGHIPGAHQLAVSRVVWHDDEPPEINQLLPTVLPGVELLLVLLRCDVRNITSLN